MQENKPRPRLTADEQIKALHRVLDMDIVPEWFVAVDGGANRGDWTQVMARNFCHVYAFEPNPTTAEKLRANLAGIDNVEIVEAGLFNRRGWATIKNPRKRQTSTASFIDPNENGQARLTTIDSFRFDGCGLIKLDLEGAEFQALQGAAKTIKRCRPVLIVEINRLSQKHFGRPPEQTHELIGAMGYKLVFQHGDDFVFKPRRAL